MSRLNKGDQRRLQGVIRKLAKGPGTLGENYIFFAQLPEEQKALLRAQSTSYRAWVRTWITPALQDLLPPHEQVWEGGERV